jgi:xanthine dehydrogenase accessory factor
MKEILATVDGWLAEGKRVAIARVIGIEESGPRDPGAVMAVSDVGEVAGSVSGGCVEGAVVEQALEVLTTGEPRRCTFGYSDDQAFAVGLTCGGTVHLLVEPLDWNGPFYLELRDALQSGEPVALVSVTHLGGEENVTTALAAKLLVRMSGVGLGTLGDPELDRVVHRDALAMLERGVSGTRHYGPRGEARREDVEVFVEVFVSPAKMVIFGAVDFSRALVEVAKVLGFVVTVCDARPVFATSVRFPTADDVVVDWPDRFLERIGASLGPRDAVCVLTHDTKFDVPAVMGALSSKVGYIGAMGSRRTHQKRWERLLEAGASEGELRARLMSPIGLDVGARTPEETAVSICAEIIAVRSGRAQQAMSPLRDGSGPIH